MSTEATAPAFRPTFIAPALEPGTMFETEFSAAGTPVIPGRTPPLETLFMIAYIAAPTTACATRSAAF